MLLPCEEGSVQKKKHTLHEYTQEHCTSDGSCTDIEEEQCTEYMKNLIFRENLIFNLPLKPNYFYFYKSKVPTNTRTSICLIPQEVKFKFVCNEYKSDLYFIPLLHTLSIHIDWKLSI